MDQIEETRRQGSVSGSGSSAGGASGSGWSAVGAHGAGPTGHVNEIVLVGRLSGAPEWKPLPEGGQVAVWRLIVEHRDARSPQDAIDTIRCVTYAPSVQEGIRDWRHGDVVEVRGSLRHRFWRGPDGPRGLYEVEAAIAVRRSRGEPGGRDRT